MKKRKNKLSPQYQIVRHFWWMGCLLRIVPVVFWYQTVHRVRRKHMSWERGHELCLLWAASTRSSFWTRDIRQRPGITHLCTHPLLDGVKGQSSKRPFGSPANDVEFLSVWMSFGGFIVLWCLLLAARLVDFGDPLSSSKVHLIEWCVSVKAACWRSVQSLICQHTGLLLSFGHPEAWGPAGPFTEWCRCIQIWWRSGSEWSQ